METIANPWQALVIIVIVVVGGWITISLIKGLLG